MPKRKVIPPAVREVMEQRANDDRALETFEADHARDSLAQNRRLLVENFRYLADEARRKMAAASTEAVSEYWSMALSFADRGLKLADAGRYEEAAYEMMHLQQVPGPVNRLLNRERGKTSGDARRKAHDEELERCARAWLEVSLKHLMRRPTTREIAQAVGISERRVKGLTLRTIAARARTLRKN